MADTEINLAQLKEYKAGEYQLIDIRNEDAFRYGSIKGAVNLPEQEIFLRKEELSAAKRLILFCAKGINSIGVAERLREEGFDAVSLEGGYGAYLMDSFQKKAVRKSRRASARNFIKQSLVNLRKQSMNMSCCNRETKWQYVFPVVRTPC